MKTIHIELRFDRADFPTPDELRVRHTLEDWIQDQSLGEVVDAGSGHGVMDVYVESSDARAPELIARHVARIWPAEAGTVRTLDLPLDDPDDDDPDPNAA